MDFLSENCIIFSVLGTFKYNLKGKPNNKFITSWQIISIQWYTDESKKKATDYCIWFGHSLWSANQLLAQEVNTWNEYSFLLLSFLRRNYRGCSWTYFIHRRVCPISKLEIHASSPNNEWYHPTITDVISSTLRLQRTLCSAWYFYLENVHSLASSRRYCSRKSLETVKKRDKAAGNKALATVSQNRRLIRLANKVFETVE